MSKALAGLIANGIPAYSNRAQRLKVVFTFNAGAARIVGADAIRVNCCRAEYEEARGTMVAAALIKRFIVSVGAYDGTGFTTLITGVR